MELPYVDEHSVQIPATPQRTWEALLTAFDRSLGAAPWFARLLGCQDTRPEGPRPLAPGSSLPGFHVAQALAPELLDLAGSHRYARYLLRFRLEPMGEGHTRLRAITRAEFPGLLGRLYRLLVISSRLHLLATRRMLSMVKKRACA